MDDNTLSQMMIDVLPRSVHLLRTYVTKHSLPNLSLPQFRILANVEKGIRTITEIAKYQGVTQPAMSQMIIQLIEKNYLSKVQNPDDKRQMLLAITNEGQQELLRVRNLVKEDIVHKLSHFSEDQKQELMLGLIALKHFI